MSKNVKILGILGGGQLGRMSAQAAAELGITVHIYTPEKDSPASQVAARTFVGPWDNHETLRAFAETVDVISYEFENIPLETVMLLKELKPVYPDEKLLAVSQHRVSEKKFLNDIGIPTARWAAVHSVDDVRKARFVDFILKTARFGYDGKGQVSSSLDDHHLPEKWAALGSDDIIIEEKIDFDYEISVIAARDVTGRTVLYGPILNKHKHHILDRSTCPADIPFRITADARKMTHHLAEAVNLVGVLALELFVTKDGHILANEIAPRTHNSGHYTIDACVTSQFAQHVRAVCGLPVGDPTQHAHATMINLIGDDVNHLEKYKSEPHAHIHLYGKAEARPGRKMGHVTILDKK